MVNNKNNGKDSRQKLYKLYETEYYIINWHAY